jgi:hypothetical protein
MAEQPPLDVLGLQWLTKERIVPQVDHRGRQEQRSIPIGLHPLQFCGLEGSPLYCRTRRAIGANRVSFVHHRVHGSLRDPALSRIRFNQRAALIYIMRTRSQAALWCAAKPMIGH